MKWLYTLVLLGASACGAASSGNPAVPGATADKGADEGSSVVVRSGLRLDIDPTDAEIWIDDDNHGSVSAMEGGVLALDPGLYRVSVKLDGYQTWRAEVTVKDSVDDLKVSLPPKEAGRN